MHLYKYRAISDSGKYINGKLEAMDLYDAREQVRLNGLVPLKIVKCSDVLSKINKKSASKIKLTDVSVFCRQLAITLKSGTSITTGLHILSRQARNKTLKTLLAGLYSEVQKGRSLSEAMADSEGSLPPLLVSMAAVGEVSGQMDEVFNRMAVYFEKENYMREKIKGAMTYPVILLLAGVGMLFFFINFVLPEITSIIKESGSELPVITKIVLGTVDILKKYYLVIIGLVIICIVAFKFALSKYKVRLVFDSMILKIPLIGVSIRNNETARFMRTFAMMIKSGIPIIKAMESIEKIMGNTVAKEGIRFAIDGVRKGEKISDNIGASGFFDEMITHMINIGEETGEMDNVLEITADYFDKEAEAWVSKVVAAIEPVFTILVGAVAAIMILAMMIPLFGMTSTLGGG